MKLVIVGAGVAGSVLARLARERGHDAWIVAPHEEPNSLAATAILRRAYHNNKPDEQQAFDYAVEQYAMWGIPLIKGALYTSHRTGDRERKDNDWLLIDPKAPLLPEDVQAHVVSVHGKRAWVGPGRCIEGDAVVTAVGATGHLAPPGKLTWGVTWEASGAHAVVQPDILRAHQYAPYKTLICGVIGGTSRLGSSSAIKYETAVAQSKKMLALAYEMGWVRSLGDWYPRMGARLQTPRQWWREPDGSWRLGGFHRTGYALAPYAAAQLLGKIEETVE